MNLVPSQSPRLLMALFLASFGCTAIPKGLVPVGDFDTQSYLGTWYEIARLDHPFERGLEDVSATYSLREDGGIEVRNRGFDPEEGEWSEAVGKAYAAGDANEGSLKVSFFGPFYGGYHIIALDEGYEMALVAGPDRSYLWLLARERSPSRERIDELVAFARDKGFAVDDLIWVNQTRHDQALASTP